MMWPMPLHSNNNKYINEKRSATNKNSSEQILSTERHISNLTKKIEKNSTNTNCTKPILPTTIFE